VSHTSIFSTLILATYSGHCVCRESGVGGTDLNRVQKRAFTRWSGSDTDVVVAYFASWVRGERECGLPVIADIVAFKKRHPDISCDWKTIRNKVLNEKMAFAKRKRLQLDSLHF